jgi:hypothetical protein
MARNDMEMPEAVAQFIDEVEAMRVRAHICLDLALDFIYLMKASPDLERVSETLVQLSADPLRKAMVNRLGEDLAAANFGPIMEHLQIDILLDPIPLDTCLAWSWGHKLEHALYDEA